MNEYTYFRVKKDDVGWISTIDQKTRTSLVIGTVYKTKNLLSDNGYNKELIEVLSNVEVLTLTSGNMNMIELI